MKTAGTFGVLAFSLFSLALLIFGLLNQEFYFVNDVISKLGANGQPLAIWWNIIGFGLVGLLLMGFGITYGKVLKDRSAGLLLALFGLGFAFTSIPIDIGEVDSAFSKAHVVAICLALAFWLFGLARISANHSQSKSIKLRANVAALLLVTSMIGGATELLSMPMTHRLVFGVVFGWTLVTAISMLNSEKELQIN
ncbi:DUF998 domain-containing protein [Roseivirga sp. E12]|uniref:DUF998 domain-containing protein n=1 Tax=Roseivirga sp. E12 TaxID=2819237 RepID=UPI001ABC25D4|nr:DUF998 domain-containing protein [Roseivirga sp. E12]MBO3697063.1 DUF998 domain-containing protein [Roseivirga sp. E12]